MVICPELGADLHMAQLMPLSLASVKSRLVLPFWYRLTRVVLEKGPLNVCVCVRACVRACVCSLYNFNDSFRANFLTIYHQSAIFAESVGLLEQWL